MSWNHWSHIRQDKLKGQIIMVPCNSMKVAHALPQPLSAVATHICSLKKRLSFKSDYLRDFICPAAVKRALTHLIGSTPLYGDLRVFLKGEAEESLVAELSEVQEYFEQTLEQIAKLEDLEVGEEEADDEQRDHQSIVFDLPPYPADEWMHIKVAPGENKAPIAIWKQPFVEEICFPTLFGGFPREVKSPKDDELSYKKICKLQLLNKDRRFARSIENLFFKFYFSEVKQLHSVLSTRGRLHCLHDVTPAMLRDKETVEKLFMNSTLFNEFKLIRGTPHYWEDVKKDLFAYFRQNS
jgi:hypothetical protein